MFRASTYSIETDQQFQLQNSESQGQQLQIKIALVGVSDVGKTSIMNRVQGEQFNPEISNTNGIQLRFVKLRFNHYIINLHIWDASGDRMLQFIKKGHFKTMDAILYVFDLTDEQSIHQLQQLHYEIKKSYVSHYISEIVLGNKLDLIDFNTQTVSNYLAKKFSQRNGLKYFRVSAKSNRFIIDSFTQVIKDQLKNNRNIRTSRLHERQKQQNQSTQCKFCSNCQII